MWCFSLVSLCLLATATAQRTCTISIQKDLSSASPLLLRQFQVARTTNDAYYLPKNRYGDIAFNENDIINLSCPNGKVIFNGGNTGQSIVPVRCTGSGKVFEVISSKATGTLSQFKCSQPGHIARYTGKSCLSGFKEIEIGFQVSSATFLREITVCFDSTKQNAAYSAYNLTRLIKGSQYSTPRPEFEDGNFYNVGNHKVNSLYTNYVQRINVNKQLGLAQNSKMYIGNGDYYLSRGHLTAKADFVYGNQHNATFFYVNAAPQWQTFNGGNWNEVEQSVRQLASDRDLDLEVYTGTHGVMTLPHATSGKQTEVYLYSENGKQAIPVPRLYWKVVYDRRTKAGIALVGLNNPYNKAVSEDVLCTDVCNQLTFSITWNRTDLVQGYGYCCEVNELRKTVKNIPNIAVNSVLL